MATTPTRRQHAPTPPLTKARPLLLLLADRSTHCGRSLKPARRRKAVVRISSASPASSRCCEPAEVFPCVICTLKDVRGYVAALQRLAQLRAEEGVCRIPSHARVVAAGHIANHV